MSNIIDKIRLSGVTYDIQGTVEASSAITSGDTNPVEGGVLYDELRIPGEVESGLTLEWELYDGGSTTNYPSGQCSKIIFENIDTTDELENVFIFNSSEGDLLGFIVIDVNDGVITVSQNNNVTYSISGNNVTVEYPSIAANVDHIYASYDNYWTTTAFVNASGMIPLINQVSANTISLSGKQDTLSAGTGISISGNVISASGGGNATVELTQAEYDALVSAGTVASDTYYIITDAQSPDITQYWTSAQTQSAITAAVSGKVDTSSLATVATSGSYNDLTNKPTIPTSTSAVTSGSTDVVTSGGVYDQMGGLKLVKLTQQEYDALSPNYDNNTLYVIT